MATSFESRRAGTEPRSRTAVDASTVDTAPARWGVRGRINSMLGPAPLLAAKSAELDSRYDSASIRRALPARRRVVVANTDGGMGKTPTTVMLAALFGQHRGGDVVAWDIAGVRGNLGRRAATATDGGSTVWDLLANAGCIRGRDQNDASALDEYVSVQPTGDEILGADRYTRHMESITVAELDAIDAALTENRQITFYDTGNDDRATAWRWATEHADQLVIPLPYRRGAGSAVTSMLATLRARGLESLIERAVVIASHPTREASSDVVADAHRHLSEFGVGRIVVVPFEPLLASWERIDQAALPTSTVRAWTHAAAEVAAAMAVGQSAMIMDSWTASSELASEPAVTEPDSAAPTDVAPMVAEPAAAAPVSPKIDPPAPSTPTPSGPTTSTPSRTDPTEFAATTAALRQWSTAPRPQSPSRTAISVSKRTAAIAAAALVAVLGVATWQLTQSESAVQPALAMPAVPDAPAGSSRSSGPAVIEAYDNFYYANRDASAAAALWDIDRSDPVETDALVQELQASIDDVDPAIRHRVDVTPTSMPDVFDVVLTLTTGDGVEYPYNQRFTVGDSGGRYSILDKIDCATTCPAL